MFVKINESNKKRKGKDEKNKTMACYTFVNNRLLVVYIKKKPNNFCVNVYLFFVVKTSRGEFYSLRTVVDIKH